MSYRPNPLITHQTSIPDFLLPLVERLAANVHDLWADKRMAEGWTYGPEKNVVLKQTPFLVPYDELPETEKETDRLMVRETVKAMLTLGYRVVPPSARPVDRDDQRDQRDEQPA